jgi:hypothetical protein
LQCLLESGFDPLVDISLNFDPVFCSQPAAMGRQWVSLCPQTGDKLRRACVIAFGMRPETISAQDLGLWSTILMYFRKASLGSRADLSTSLVSSAFTGRPKAEKRRQAAGQGLAGRGLAMWLFSTI